MTGRGPYWLDPADRSHAFPPVEHALHEPDGLLAVGGDLAPQRILNAYRHGIFPWFSPGQPILWWSPDPRAVLFPDKLKVARSLRKTINKGSYQVRFDTAFARVIRACAETPRRGQNGTWITEEMQQAYIRLHEMGYAHSAESWQGEELVGGLYGIRLGRVFYGESMFSHKTDASKVAFVHLVRKLQAEGVVLIDCQVTTDHLLSLGAEEIPRRRFIELLRQYAV
ncbi:leucyl/phenylalanyl-tRNA--protein transferase [Sulfurivermis fontis]|uniref:leucyl/phenylalanyl-tRNA--protein transferase n=1 Tax=Sulfurivermis fontis TaxID=1972068 RepID=UPI000FDBA9A6|nr:leucyl/phenylalanyl-tRNA--protein transferase [Sulfurivermis fontis]